MTTHAWLKSPVTNWIGTGVSLVMLVLYVQRLLEPDSPANTPYVTIAWALMFLAWSGSAVYKTWFK